VTGRHARPDDVPGHPSRTAVVTTAARLLVAKYAAAVEAAGDEDGAALWCYLPDNWPKMAEQLARVLVQESDNAQQAHAIRAAAGEQDFVCPACQSEFFRLIYRPAAAAAGRPPYRVVCARCQGGAEVIESGPLDGSHIHRWGPQ
jgi:hypothetical protein